MRTEESPNTSHTLNPVPLMAVNQKIDELNELWQIENVIEELLEL